MRLALLSLLLLALAAPPAAAQKWTGPTLADGTEVQIDVPLDLRLRNVGGSDGKGLCVSSSVTVAARLQGEARLLGLRAWCEKRPGGSWPERLMKDLKEFAPDAPVFQVTGADLTFIRLCLENGYLVSCTWGGNHMLNLVHLDDRHAVILDNNSPWGEEDGRRADTKLQVMTPREFQQKASMGGGIWIVVVLGKCPPSPIPVNALPEAGPRWQAPVYEWRHWHKDPGNLYLWHGDRQVGGWLKRTSTYHAYDGTAPAGQRWSRACAPPVPLPAFLRTDLRGDCVVESVRDYGCRWSQGVGAPPKFTLCGKEISRGEAEKLVTRYAKAPRLSVVGDDALRKRMQADFASSPALAPFRDALCVQDYGPGDSLAKGVGLAPGITLGEPPDAQGRSKTVWRLREYDGPEALAAALRRPGPYDPNKDPDPRKPAPAPGPRPQPNRPAPGPEPALEADLSFFALPCGLLAVRFLVLSLPGRGLPPSGPGSPNPEDLLWTLLR